MILFSSLNEEEKFFGSVIFRLLNVMPCNVHDISEFETPIMDSFVPGCTKVSLGKFLNHSVEISGFFCLSDFT